MKTHTTRWRRMLEKAGLITPIAAIRKGTRNLSLLQDPLIDGIEDNFSVLVYPRSPTIFLGSTSDPPSRAFYTWLGGGKWAVDLIFEDGTVVGLAAIAELGSGVML